MLLLDAWNSCYVSNVKTNTKTSLLFQVMQFLTSACMTEQFLMEVYKLEIHDTIVFKII